MGVTLSPRTRLRIFSRASSSRPRLLIAGRLRFCKWLHGRRREAAGLALGRAGGRGHRSHLDIDRHRGGGHITAYMKFLGWPIHKAVGTAAGFGPLIAVPATIGFMAEGWGLPLLPPLSLGYVNLSRACRRGSCQRAGRAARGPGCAPAFAPRPESYFHDLPAAGRRPVCREPRFRSSRLGLRFRATGCHA